MVSDGAAASDMVLVVNCSHISELVPGTRMAVVLVAVCLLEYEILDINNLPILPDHTPVNGVMLPAMEKD